MLYASADRIAQRTGALLRARVTGRHAGDVIADLAQQAAGTNDVRRYHQQPAGPLI